jgi:hypothetical protein
MTSRIAQRRAAKAVRRKQRAKMKRQHAGDPVAASAQRAHRWVSAPLHSCLIQGGLFKLGFGTVVLARKAGVGEVAMAAFLVDIYCRGVKDVVFRCIDLRDFRHFLGEGEIAAPWEPVDPSYARKLLREAAKYGDSLGFRPHRDFTAVEALFGEISADACDTVFRFGQDGKPCYIPSPNESQAKIRKTLERLRSRLGDGGFTYLVPVDEIDLFDDDPWEEISFDEMSPNEIPF